MRLGDILLRQKAVKPHQIDVALDVQKRTKLPIGQILVETKHISRLQLMWALCKQKMLRALGIQSKPLPDFRKQALAQGATRILSESEIQERRNLASQKQD